MKVTVLAPGSVNTEFGGAVRNADWMLQPDDIAATIVELLRARDGAHLSRIEMRPARPQAR